MAAEEAAACWGASASGGGAAEPSAPALSSACMLPACCICSAPLAAVDSAFLAWIASFLLESHSEVVPTEFASSCWPPAVLSI